MDVPEVRSLFEPSPGRIYLDTPTYGLPPRPTLEALRSALDGWRTGEARWMDDWDREGDVCRSLFARLISVPERSVSLQPAVSVSAGIVASAVPEGGEVLLAEGDFTSVTYPFLAAAEAGRMRVRSAPLERLVDAVGPGTSMVAVSIVQSADGRAVDLEALRAATDGVGAQLFLDGSQSIGLLPLDATAAGADYVAAAAYKWLCCPRGVAFFYVRPDRWHEPWPVTASWRGDEDPYGHFYGTELHLAEDAARFDVSLAWHPWVGARRSLEVLLELDDATRFELGHGAASHLAELLGLPPPAAGIVQIPVADGERAAAELERAGVRASVRAGKVRVGFHFYNTRDEAEHVARLLGPLRAGP